MAASYRLPPTFVATQGEFEMPAFADFAEWGKKCCNLGGRVASNV